MKSGDMRGTGKGVSDTKVSGSDRPLPFEVDIGLDWSDLDEHRCDR